MTTKKINPSKIIVLILITTSLLILSASNNSTITTSSLIDNEKSSPSIQALVDHAPIKIISDDNFTDYGFNGAGTVEDPYIITDYNITTTEIKGIFIKDTTKHFVISYCYIKATGFGINLVSIASGTATILNTTLNEIGLIGVYLEYSSSVSIINCTMTKNGWDGIELFYSPGAVIINNTLSDNGDYGIELWHSNNSTLTNNVFYNDGVYFYDISITNYLNFSFENNWVNGKILGYYKGIDDLTLTDPDYGQLILVNCKRPTIYNQNLSDTAIGMLLYDCDYADIMNNTCSYNQCGIYLESSTYSIIVNNTCNNNEDAIKTMYDYESTFVNNTCNFNFESGLRLFISHDCIVYNNTYIENVLSAIYIWSCSGNIVTNNTCLSSNYFCIYLESSASCLLAYNDIQYSFLYGIYLNFDSYDNVLHHNKFTDNNLGGDSQGYDDGTNNIWFDTITLEGNWWSDWTGISPYPLDGDANNNDPYPQGPITISEFSTGILIIFILSLFGVAVVPLSLLTKKRMKNI